MRNCRKWKVYRVVILGFCLFSAPFLYAQKKDSLAHILAGELPVEQKIKLAERLVSSAFKSGFDSLAYLDDQFAYWLYDHDLERTIFYEDRAFKRALAADSADKDFIQQVAISLGFYYEKARRFKEAIRTYKKVIITNKTTSRSITAYGKIGYCAGEIQDYHTAIAYYELVLSLRGNNNNRSILAAYTNLMTYYTGLGTDEALKKAIQYGTKADSLSDTIPTDISTLFKINLGLAQLHNQDNHLDLVLSSSYYNHALSIAQEAKDTTRIIQAYYGLGSLYNLFDKNRSISYHNKALSLTSPQDSINLYLNWQGLARTHALAGDYYSSFQLRNKALKWLTGFDFENIERKESGSLVKIDSKNYLRITLTEQALCYLKLFEANADTTLLDQSLIYFELADDVIDLMQANSENFKSRLFWRQVGSDLYSKAITASFHKGDKEKAFYFLEKNKALLLMEDISNQQFKISLKKSDEQLEWEREKKLEILALQHKLEATNSSKKEYENLSKQLIDLEIELSLLKEDSSQTLSNELKAPTITTLEQTRSQLKDNEVLVSYHFPSEDTFGIYDNSDSGYIFWLSRDSTYLLKVSDLQLLRKDIKLMLDQFKKPFQLEEDITNYTERSFAIFQQLFPNDRLRATIKGKKVRIITDDYLSFLPFEALCTSEETLQFLIEDVEISYMYSNSFSVQQRKRIIEGTGYLGIAPVQFDIHDLVDLPGSRSEILSLKSHFDGVHLVGEEATKSNFLKHLKGSAIVHLATHADAQSTRSPWIALSDEKITLEELYLNENDATLVYLSACKTAVGQFELGEGVMSLARAFFYGGAKTVISSLWNSDDRSSAFITDAFYKSLKQGKNKSEALRNSKLQYLASHHASELSPHYWASHILLGDHGDINDQKKIKFLHFLIAGLSLLIFSFRKRIFAPLSKLFK